MRTFVPTELGHKIKISSTYMRIKYDVRVVYLYNKEVSILNLLKLMDCK